jgi:hypothetical protein
MADAWQILPVIRIIQASRTAVLCLVKSKTV